MSTNGDHAPKLWGLRAASEDMLYLDLMRFVASCGIVLCHSGEFFVPLSLRESSHERLAGLALFVDVFFVISGFVIAHVYRDRMNDWRDFLRFMQRRVGRLLPLHLATLAAMALLYWLIGQSGFATHTDLRFIPGCVAVGAVLMHAVVNCGGPVPNGVSWSISAEMVMYLLFPLLHILGIKAGRWRALVWLALMGTVMWRYGGSTDWARQTDYLRALPSFFLGLALHMEWKRLAELRGGAVLGFGCAILLVVGSLLLWPFLLLIALAYGTAIGAIAADARAKPPHAVRRLAPLGQLTYSMYMLHPIIIMVLVNALGDKILHLGPPALSALTLVSFGLILVVSWVSFGFFETPARRYIDSLPLINQRPKQVPHV